MSTVPPTPGGGGAPPLSIGLPVYNGERFLAQAIDALLAQTYPEFELIISDNASTDSTAEICRSYVERDARIRYVRQPVNIGAAPNHNFVFAQARGRYFKWASHDDLYAADLLRLCVEALETRPDVVLAHAWDAFIDEHGKVIRPLIYLLDTASPRPPARLRSLLYGSGGNDIYGVIRTEVFRRVGPLGSYHNADRCFVAALSLQGPFYQVPRMLYFRRDHPDRGERASTRRARSANLDPRRADRVRNPMIRLHTEYVRGYVAAIYQAPLSRADRYRCLIHVAGWLLSHLRPGATRRLLDSSDPAVLARAEQTLASHARLVSPLLFTGSRRRRASGSGPREADDRDAS
ncbi:MAG: glycosyltransferase family 2 protein [Actinomycetota bacterium]|nr:glycosyltransferase family 2 protein [Actinomycetota bacterium]